MPRLKIIEPQVKEALINNVKTRGDNYILYLEVLKKYVDLNMSLNDVFKNHALLGIPSLESITRARRKLQERYPELRDEKISKIRSKEEAEHREYALEDTLWY